MHPTHALLNKTTKVKQACTNSELIAKAEIKCRRHHGDKNVVPCRQAEGENQNYLRTNLLLFHLRILWFQSSLAHPLISLLSKRKNIKHVRTQSELNIAKQNQSADAIHG
jgi:hypothetical protein